MAEQYTTQIDYQLRSQGNDENTLDIERFFLLPG